MSTATGRHIPLFSTDVRSTDMFTLHESLARERTRSCDRDAQHWRVARELAAARRWQRFARHAEAASEHARRAHRRHAMRAV